MSLSTRPPVSPGEDLDGLLRAFYQAQLPHPWPDFKAPGTAGTPSVRPASAAGIRRFALLRSRLALAASVALLILGSFLLPRQAPQQSGPEVEIRSPTATNIYLEQRQGEPTRIKVDAVYEKLPPRKSE